MKKLYPLFFLLLISATRIFAASPPESDYYWVGGSGNWTDATNHWATSSGGSTFHTLVPSESDNVIFDANSFSGSGQTVTVNSLTAYCKNMTWTGATNNPTFTNNISLL
jgi:hypothetical protein